MLCTFGGKDDDSSHNQWDSISALPANRVYVGTFVSHVECVISRTRYGVLDEIDSFLSVIGMNVYLQFMEVGNQIQKSHLMNEKRSLEEIMNGLLTL